MAVILFEAGKPSASVPPEGLPFLTNPRGFRVTVDWMEVIEAEFKDGVLRPMRHLALRPGERVGIVVVRRPDPSRWDLSRLARVVSDEDSLTAAGLADWETTLSREDRS